MVVICLRIGYRRVDSCNPILSTSAVTRLTGAFDDRYLLHISYHRFDSWVGQAIIYTVRVMAWYYGTMSQKIGSGMSLRNVLDYRDLPSSSFR